MGVKQGNAACQACDMRGTFHLIASFLFLFFCSPSSTQTTLWHFRICLKYIPNECCCFFFPQMCLASSNSKPSDAIIKPSNGKRNSLSRWSICAFLLEVLLHSLWFYWKAQDLQLLNIQLLMSGPQWLRSKHSCFKMPNPIENLWQDYVYVHKYLLMSNLAQ